MENWDGWTKPYLFMAPPPPSWMPSSMVIQQSSSAAIAGISFAVSFLVSLAAMACYAFGRRKRMAGGRLKATTPEADPFLDDAANANTAPPLEPAEQDDDEAFDVFLSYRRADYWLADTVYDKLRLCGLRVFKDAGGRLAGLLLARSWWLRFAQRPSSRPSSR